MNIITIERKVLEKNDEIAQKNRRLFKDRGIFVLNFVSSPGAGKTSILEKTFQELRTKMRMAVIEGDVQTDLDAQRVASYSVPVVQIVTMGGCHLEANLIQRLHGPGYLGDAEVHMVYGSVGVVVPYHVQQGLVHAGLFKKTGFIVIHQSAMDRDVKPCFLFGPC